MKTEQIKTLAKIFQKHGIYLSGSRALALQGIDLERPFADVDFVANRSDEVTKTAANLFSLISNGQAEIISEPEGLYLDDAFIFGAVIDGLKFDIRQEDNINLVKLDGLEMQSSVDILNKKYEYAISGSRTAAKHEKDLILLGIDMQNCLKALLENDTAKERYQKTLKEKDDIIQNIGLTNQYNLRIKLIQSGRKAYQNHITEYEITSVFDKEKTKDLIRKWVDMFTNLQNEVQINYQDRPDYFEQASPFGCEKFYAFYLIDNATYRLVIAKPFV